MDRGFDEVKELVQTHILGVPYKPSWLVSPWHDTKHLIDKLGEEGFYCKIVSPFIPDIQLRDETVEQHEKRRNEWNARFDHHGATGFDLWASADTDPIKAVWRAAVELIPEVEIVRLHKLLVEQGGWERMDTLCFVCFKHLGMDVHVHIDDVSIDVSLGDDGVMDSWERPLLNTVDVVKGALIDLGVLDG